MTQLIVIAAFMLSWGAGGVVRVLVVPAGWAAAAAWAWPVVGGAAAVWLGGAAGRAMDRRGDVSLLGMSRGVVWGYQAGGVAWHAVCVLLAGWMEAVRGVVGDVVALDELISAMPLALVLSLGAAARYPVERRLREAGMIGRFDLGRSVSPMPGALRWLIGVWRHQVLVFAAPMAALGAWSEAVGLVGGRLGWGDTAQTAAQVAGSLAVLAASPWVIRVIWDTVRLRSGPLHARLAGLCARHGVHASGVLIWRTGGMVVNAAAIGVLPRPRYIILSDGLLEELEPAEVDAVAAHEVGHLRLRHLPWLAASVLATVGVTGAASGLASRALGAAGLEGVLGLAPTLAGVIVVLGYVSRRFEWQADAFAVADAAVLRGGPGAVIGREDVTPMVTALSAVARLGGLPRGRFMWRHGSILERQARLKGLVGERAGAMPIDRVAGRVKRLVAIGCVVGGAALLLGVWRAV